MTLSYINSRNINHIVIYSYTLTGNFVDLRSGIIYISLIGMTATHEERSVFIELDRLRNYRKELIATLKETAREIGILDDVVISEGGMVGIGLYPKRPFFPLNAGKRGAVENISIQFFSRFPYFFTPF